MATSSSMCVDLLGKSALMSWWHGRGSLLDYSNPDAVKWWHEQMDKALSTGIDGWKCDGTDPYILEVVDARGHSGHVSYRNYADHYYGDFFDHTRAVRGKDALIMSRPVDVYVESQCFAFSVLFPDTPVACCCWFSRCCPIISLTISKRRSWSFGQCTRKRSKAR
eukprot:scpid86544/ scgid4791/ 